jgi:RNA polymerase sigma factor (sigma-70 family)
MSQGASSKPKENGTMQVHDTSEHPTGLLPDDLVVSRMEFVRRLAWQYADESIDHFEELYSIGLVAMCEAAASLPVGCSNPGGYIYKAAEYRMIDEVKRRKAYAVVSLDEPFGSDSSFSLGDLLPDSPLASAPVSSKRERALNGALRRLCSSQQRGVLRRRYALVGYGAHSVEATAVALRTTIASVDAARYQGLGRLRKDAHLCKVMGVEVPPVVESSTAKTGAIARVLELLEDDPDMSAMELARVVGCDPRTARRARKQYREAQGVTNG